METYLSNLSYVMPTTKKEAENLAEQLVNEITQPEKAVEFLAMYKHFDTLMSLIKGNEKLMQLVKDAEEMEALGCNVSIKSRTTYDFSESDEWKKLDKKEKEIKAEKKEIENRMKFLSRSPKAGMVDLETGEFSTAATVKKITEYMQVDYATTTDK